jgi:long-chain acyl-CoA synthetase
VSLFSENSSRWIVADQGIMSNGCADAVRGAASPAEELCYILSHSGSTALVVQDAATLAKLLPALSQVRAGPPWCKVQCMELAVMLLPDRRPRAAGAPRL